MVYDLDQAARVSYAAIRQLREEQGCRRGPAWPLLVIEEQEWYRKAVQMAGAGCPPRVIHEHWRLVLEAGGWKHGPDIDHVKKTHPELQPWDLLGEPLQRRLFVVQMVTTGLFLPC